MTTSATDARMNYDDGLQATADRMTAQALATRQAFVGLWVLTFLLVAGLLAWSLFGALPRVAAVGRFWPVVVGWCVTLWCGYRTSSAEVRDMRMAENLLILARRNGTRLPTNSTAGST